MHTISLPAYLRTKIGTNNSRKYRNQTLIPAIIYKYQKKTILINISHNIFYPIFNNINIYKNLFLLTINKQKILTYIKNIQNHPFKNKILHIDFIYK